MSYRQGDVLIISIDVVPEGAQAITPDARNRFVLAEGEATGHAHAIQVSDGVQVTALAEALFIRAGFAVDVTHEEHETITLPPGIYRVVRQVEYTPARLRRVLD